MEGDERAPAWHRLTADDVVARLGSEATSGLSDEAAAGRLEEHGPNELVDRSSRGLPLIIFEQIRQVLVLILIAAAVVSLAVGEHTDAMVILAIVLLNTILGTVQEYRAERAIAALRQMATPTVRVRRGGRSIEIPSPQLVPGDIVELEAGAIVPADARLLEAHQVLVEEAALTGESEPVTKDIAPLDDPDLPLGDRRCLLYRGTTIATGRATAVIVATGMETEIGHIAGMISGIKREPTPLQRRLTKLAHHLALIALGLVVIVILLGMWRGGVDQENLRILFLTGVSLAVAAIPEGLPAVVTITLALGSQRMLKRRALIRKLPAAESLGSVTIICSDKTGTLTENRMQVQAIETVDGKALSVDELAQHDTEALAHPLDEATSPEDRAFGLLLYAMTLCNDARLPGAKGEGESCAVGDPTEVALVEATANAGLDVDDLARRCPRVGEIPFSSERRRMTTIHETEDAMPVPHDGTYSHLAVTKGAPEALLPLATHAWLDGGPVALSERPEIAEAFREVQDRYAGKGFRVLGFAAHFLPSAPSEAEIDEAETHLVLLGLAAMHDPPRPEAKDAVARCRSAGIRPMMITGDHPLTALEIAREIGIADGDDRVLTGRDLDQLDAAGFDGAVREVSVYARVSPEHKLRIVESLQSQGEIASMTGDGVNDAPALKRADIGVAMGITGTDVSKEAADMVLLDDNFATIVAAVEEGRVIFDNIRKFVKYTLSSNTGEIIVMLAAPFLGMPMALLPVQILWINLVTDGLPGLALAVEPPERDIMKRPPFRPRENIFRRGLGWRILFIGLLMGATSLGTGFVYWLQNPEGPWQTIIFTTLTLSQLGNACAIRSRDESLFTIGLFSNRPLLGAVALTFALQLMVVYVPFFQTFFHTEALPLRDLAIVMGVSSAVFWAVEVEKWLRRVRG